MSIRPFHLFAAALATLFLTGCAMDPGSAALDPVRLQLKWKHQFQFAGYYAAIEKGYYARRGLSVELIEAEGESNPIDQVVAGEAEYGVAGQDLLLVRAMGAPVVALAGIYQSSPLGLLARRDAGIETVADLRGKTLALEPNLAPILALLETNGVTLDDLTVAPRGYTDEALINGTVDAVSVYVSGEVYPINEAGVDSIVFTPAEAGISFPGDLLFTTEDEIAAHPERVEALRAATLEGWAYAVDHPQEIIDLILAKYDSQHHSRAYLTYEAEVSVPLVLAGEGPIGRLDPDQWRAAEDSYARLGLLPNRVNLDTFLYEKAK